MEASNNNKRDRTRDDYGFVVPTPYVSLFRDCRRVYAVEEEHRITAWRTWTAGYEGCLASALEAARVGRVASNGAGTGDASTSGGSVISYHELGVLVKTMGVPKEMRRQVWLACLVEDGWFGAGRAGDWSRSMLESEYEGLVGQMEGAAFADDLQQIEKDLHRTFPNHALTNDVWGKASLRRVLGAYAVRNPLVGYCQGLNFLAAMFLLVFVDIEAEDAEEVEEAEDRGYSGKVEGSAQDGPLLGKNGLAAEAAAFSCFTVLVEQILTGYFDPMMINQQVDGLVFEQLVREVLPDVAGHFDDVGVHAPTAVAGWFLVAFVNTLATESTMRVWDVLFFEKSPAVLFRVGLGLMSVYKEAILECRTDGDTYMLLQAIGPITFNASGLMEAIEDLSHIKGSVVQVLRDKYAPGVTKVMNRMFHACGGGGGGSNGSGGLGVLSAGSSMGASNATSTSSSGYRGSSDARKFETKNAVSADIEKRLGILRLRHKDPAGLAQPTIQGSSGPNNQSMTQDSLRRTQSALVDSTPGIVLQGRNERLQQQLRINLLAMRTFVPDMKLLTTALRIASGNSRDEGNDTGHHNDPDACDGHGKGSGHTGSGAEPAIETTTEGTDHVNEKVIVPQTEGNFNNRTPGTASKTKRTPVTRRFTDGGALLASPFKEGTQGAGQTMAVTPRVGSMNPMAHLSSASDQGTTSAQKLPLEKLRNIDAIKSALAAEVGRSVELLKEISASNLQLEATVTQVGDQLCKLQDEIGHKVSTYDALFQRAQELQEETNIVEVTYRKQLAANLQLADSWRKISKEIKKNDVTLKKLMDLAETRAAVSTDLLARSAEPPSPTKKFRQRAQSMVNKKFTR